MYTLKKIKQQIANQLSNALGKTVDLSEISKPPKPEYGDLSFPVFKVAKELNQDAEELAEDLAKSLKPIELIRQIGHVGPFLNFTFDTEKFVIEILNEISQDKDKYGRLEIFKDHKINLEYVSPNTNKPLTIGHLRNLCLGEVLANLYANAGAEPIRACLYNDRGIAITKSMLAYDLYGKKTTPEDQKIKPDHFVGKYYVLFNQKAKEEKKLETAAREMLQLWESGNKSVIELWQKMNKWFYQGVEKTYRSMNVHKFDKYYYESQFYQKGKEIVMEGLKKGILKQADDGAIYVDLSKEKLEDKTLIRADGTSLYITQDLALAEIKEKESADKYLIIVADEQNLQMKQLFAILKQLGKDVEKFEHLSYGMMRLPEGRIKSREGGGTALADSLIEELKITAEKEIRQREPEIKEKELKNRAEKIALAALKFYILSVDPKKNMIFDPKKSLSFTGKTGPYLLYTIARLKSVLKNSDLKIKKISDKNLPEPNERETELLRLLAEYPENVKVSLQSHDPSILAQSLYQLAEQTSSYYHQYQILKSPEKLFRLSLITSIIQVLENGLGLLSLETLEKM